ncbi:UDP-glucose 4-epimerase [Bacteroidia bacterium]|nr:UDP-glucose 4-epimerase [Bacteroidia bacterium]
MAKILVTGGLGFIGSHTALELLRNGNEVLIIDNLYNSSIDVLHRLEAILGKKISCEIIDLQENMLVNDFFDRHQFIDAVIHFSAYKAVGESVKEPLKYYRNNINSLLNILDAMQNHGVKNIVFSSSCTVYGEPDIIPVTEKSPVKPASSPYGYTKQVCENILQDMVKSKNGNSVCEGMTDPLNVIALRYFNPIGADESGKIGELPQGEPANLMPYITQTAMGIRKVLKVFGNDYNTPDGTCIRDYIHITDLAKAHIKALDRLGEMDGKFEIYNIGTGQGYSVLDIIRSFERSTGIGINWEFAPRREGDIEKIYANPALAAEKLHWKAEKQLDEMTLSAWNWEQQING